MAKIRCSRSYAQHQLGMLQGLFPTLPILIFSCASELHAQQKPIITHVLQSSHSTQTSNTHVLQMSCSTHSCASELALNINIKSLMCFSAHAQHKHLINYVLQGPHPTHEIIYMLNKKYAFVLHPIYQTNHHPHVQLSLMPNIQNKTSKQHHMQWDLCP